MVLVSGAIRRLDASPDFTYFITCKSLGNNNGKIHGTTTTERLAPSFSR